MSDNEERPAEEQPSMEEILASIRKIISEDAEEIEKAPEPVVEEPEPIPEPEPEPEPLELTDMYEEPEEEEPLELMDAYEEEPLVLEDEEPLVLEDERLVSNYTEEVGVASLAQLENSIRMGHSGETLEVIVKGLLRPMLKLWLDENLPEMVERMVQREIDRMASGARRVSNRDDY